MIAGAVAENTLCFPVELAETLEEAAKAVSSRSDSISSIGELALSLDADSRGPTDRQPEMIRETTRSFPRAETSDSGEELSGFRDVLAPYMVVALRWHQG